MQFEKYKLIYILIVALGMIIIPKLSFGQTIYQQQYTNGDETINWYNTQYFELQSTPERQHAKVNTLKVYIRPEAPGCTNATISLLLSSTTTPVSDTVNNLTAQSFNEVIFDFTDENVYLDDIGQIQFPAYTCDRTLKTATYAYILAQNPETDWIYVNGGNNITGTTEIIQFEINSTYTEPEPAVYFNPIYTSGSAFGMADFKNFPVCFDIPTSTISSLEIINLDMWVTYKNINSATTTTDKFTTSTSTNVDGIQVQNATHDVENSCWSIIKTQNLNNLPGQLYTATAYLIDMQHGNAVIATSSPWTFSIQISGLQLEVPITSLEQDNNNVVSGVIWDHLGESFPFNMMYSVLNAMNSYQFNDLSTSTTAQNLSLNIKMGNSTTTVPVFSETLLHKFMTDSQMNTLKLLIAAVMWTSFISYLIWRIRTLWVAGSEVD